MAYVEHGTPVYNVYHGNWSYSAGVYTRIVDYYNCGQACGEGGGGGYICGACNTSCQVCNTCESSCQHQGQLVSSQKNLANYITYNKAIDIVNIGDDDEYSGNKKQLIDHAHWNALIDYINTAVDYVNSTLDELLIKKPNGLKEHTALEIKKAKIAYEKTPVLDKKGEETDITITEPWENLPEKKENELITSSDFKKVNNAIKLFKYIQDKTVISEQEIPQEELSSNFESQQLITRADFKKLVDLMNDTAGVPNLVPCCEVSSGEYCIKCDVKKLIT